MSGVFWEADKQPNLCEAASGFTLSTVNLLVAIPMAVVDLGVSIAVTLAGLAWLVIGPVMDIVQGCLLAVLALAGVEDWSRDQTLATLLGLAIVLGPYFQYRGKVPDLAARMVNILMLQGQFWLWLVGFLAVSVTSEQAAYPRLVSLALAMQFGAKAVTIMFQEFNNYARAQKPNALNGVGAGLARCLELESVSALCVAVWGYPQFAAGDQVTQYYCLVPLVATILLHQRDVRPLCEEAPDSVDSHVNGDAVPVKDAAPAPAPETVLEEAPPPEAAPAPAPAAGEEAAADVSVAEKVAALEEKVADGSTVETIAEEKTEALVSRVRGAVAGLVASVLALAAPLTGLVTRACALVSSLPWAALTLLLASTLSHLLPCLAWLAITNNPLAYALPVCSLLLPTIVAKVDKLPACLGPALLQASSLGLSVAQYCLVTGLTIAWDGDEE